MQIIFRILRHKSKTKSNINFGIVLYSWLSTLLKKFTNNYNSSLLFTDFTGYYWRLYLLQLCDLRGYPYN